MRCTNSWATVGQNLTCFMRKIIVKSEACYLAPNIEMLSRFYTWFSWTHGNSMDDEQSSFPQNCIGMLKLSYWLQTRYDDDLWCS